MKIGYARVSTTGQNLASQIELLEKYGVDKIVTEKISGVAKIEDRELNELINNFLREGDELIVTSMSRLGRNSKQLLELLEDFQQRGIRLILLDLNIDTGTPLGKMFITILASFSEYERELLRERQRAGIETGKKTGVYKGGKQRFKESAVEDALEKYYAQTHTVQQLCDIYGFSRMTFYRRKKEYEAKKQENII